MDRLNRWPARLAVSGIILIASVAVLWLRKSEHALLGPDDIGEAIWTVAFYWVPPLVLYVSFLRSRDMTVVVGALLLALSTLQWWATARDPHSTAGIGPFFAAWIMAPGLVTVGVFAERAARGRAS